MKIYQRELLGNLITDRRTDRQTETNK